MKKTLFLLLLSHCVFAQNQTTKRHRYLGFGVNLGSLQSTEFILNVDPIKYFRTEIRYGQDNTSEEVYYLNNNGQQQSTNLKSSSRSIRLGLFGLLPLDDMLLFGGFRYSWGKNVNESFEYGSFFPGQNVYVNTDLINNIETVLGSEYRFFNRLALGAEIAYVIGKTNQSTTELNYAPRTNKENYFRTTAFIRFFPF